jgi:DMSO/TMAO reductase YedYZ molybdopterin-dependent catalytic subunit
MGGAPVAAPDVLVAGVQSTARYPLAMCDGGYETNVPLWDVTGGKALFTYADDDQPLAPEHGGPARLPVARLYLRKGAH